MKSGVIKGEGLVAFSFRAGEAAEADSVVKLMTAANVGLRGAGVSGGGVDGGCRASWAGGGGGVVALEAANLAVRSRIMVSAFSSQEIVFCRMVVTVDRLHWRYAM